MDKIAIKNLTFRYTKDGKDIIKDLDFSLDAESFNVLYGPSGCGKSTLMRIMAGLYPEYAGHVLSGEMYFDGKSTAEWTTQDVASAISILFQDPVDQFSMKTVRREFIFTLENLGIDREKIDRIVEISLKRIGIFNLIDRHLDTLSGGELQKVSLAITIAMNSDVIILDEPFASVDTKSRAQLLELLKDLQVNDHKTILITDHDLIGYQNLIDHLYHFQNQSVVLVDDPSQVFAKYHRENQQLTFSLPDQQVGNSLIRIDDLELINGPKDLIKDSTLGIPKGKMILLTGENGSGKSTFFSALTRLHDYKGTITYQNKDIQKYKQRKYAREVGLIFQDAKMQYLKLTVQEEIELSLKHTNYQDYWTAETVDQYLQKLHLDQLKDQIVYQLSGGQKKKLQIFEILILGDPVLLFDEPLAGLDIDSTHVVMEMIKELSQKQNQTIIMISHQLGGLQEYFDYHLQLSDLNLQYTEVLNYESIS
ncbi:ABC transporter ATP-binding protein [Companilactobacillus sp.]|uniref:ABC transporter ATP-binding protein n=1 Tax=Companilactobacillus sp. TaxID=2767905 RepID=UPI002604D15A|nr:ABC transporter ATP-binding protein [Companilactobacillus sp.]